MQAHIPHTTTMWSHHINCDYDPCCCEYAGRESNDFSSKANPN